MSLRVIIACGGTGGHLFPGIAVAEELQARGHDTMLLVSRKSIDGQALRSHSHLKAHALPTVGWPGLFNLKVFTFILQLWHGLRAGQEIFQSYQPSVVLGMGGFISAVPWWAARKKRLPVLLHESNAFPGKVTRLAAGRVSKVLLGFAKCAEYLTAARCVVTGTPVRAGLKKMSKTEAAAVLHLSSTAPTILIMGGSQGASGINRLWMAALEKCGTEASAWQFIHLTGEKNLDEVRAFYQARQWGAVVEAFSYDMAPLYSLADLAVSRSGAASLTEISHYGLPGVLIPFPAATDDHQRANARIYEQAGAAVVCEQAETSPENLAQIIKNLFSESTMLERMKQASAALGITNAASRVANEVELCAKN